MDEVAVCLWRGAFDGRLAYGTDPIITLKEPDMSNAEMQKQRSPAEEACQHLCPPRLLSHASKHSFCTEMAIKFDCAGAWFDHMRRYEFRAAESGSGRRASSSLGTTAPGLLLMFGWTFSLFFHLCNGIRHLVWDAGYGFELGIIYASGWMVVAASTALTVAAWFSSFVVIG
jgi:hypothetical protein